MEGAERVPSDHGLLGNCPPQPAATWRLAANRRCNLHGPETGLKLGIRRSLQLGVFRLGLLEHRNVGVGVFPEGEEILVGSP